MVDTCGVCREKADNLVSLKFKDESERILYKLTHFIPANVSKLEKIRSLHRIE